MCGAACMRMVLASFGIKKSESDLAKVLDIKKAGFAGNDLFLPIAERFGLRGHVQKNAKVADIAKLLKEGYRVIVNFIDPEMKVEKITQVGKTGYKCTVNFVKGDDAVGHFAVVRSIDKKVICLLDPWNGPYYALPLALFKKNWRSMFEPDVGVLIGIRK